MNQPYLASDPPKKLTSWKKEPTLVDLKNDLDMAKNVQGAQLAKIQKWNDLMNIRGAAKPPKVPGRSSVQPKLIRRQAEWRYSALTEPFLGTDNLFRVNPVTYEDLEAAKQNELVINWQFRTKLNKVKFIDDFIRSTVDEGTGIIRVGWDRSTIKVKEEAPVFSFYPIQTEEELAPLAQALELKTANPRQYSESVDPALKAAVDFYEETQEATIAVQTGTEQVEVEKVLKNAPTVELINPSNIYIDPSCNGDMDKALFAVVSFETNKAELEKNPKRYKNLNHIDWDNAAPVGDGNHVSGTPNEAQFKDPARKKVVAYEYWGWYDIEGNGTLEPIVATWIGSVLVRMEKNPFPDQKLPFVLVPYLPVKRELYGEPDAELLEENQKIIGATMRSMIDILGRTANGQQGFAKGMLDPINRRRYDDGRDYEFNPVQNPQQNLISHKSPDIPQSSLTMLQLQNNEAESLSGVKAYAGGISGEALGDVAAGIRGVLDASSKREMAILRRLAKGIKDVGAKIISMNSEFLSESEVVRVTNEQFVEINREDLKGNFDLIVDIATAEVDNTKAQDLGFMLQTIGPNLDQGITMTILSEIATLKRMPSLAHKLANFKPQISPEQQRMQELELKKAELEVDKLQSEVDLNRAKAFESQAKADNIDLDTDTSVSGVAHARNMEQQKAQSQGNQNLEVTKALTKPRKDGEKAPNIEAAVGFNALSDTLASPGGVQSVSDRDALAATNPQLSLGSGQFDPRMDPSLNPGIRI